MSEETKNPDTNDDSGVSTEEKQSNKTFSQSEFDSRLATELNKFKTQYSDYDELKENFLEMKKWKEQKEQESMTEQEKMTNLVQNTAKENESLKSERDGLLTEIMKKDILLDKKYADLPIVYKQAVIGNSRDSIR
jgi:hypothetical protein